MEKLVIVMNQAGSEVFRKWANDAEIANIETYVINCKKWHENEKQEKRVYIQAG